MEVIEDGSVTDVSAVQPPIVISPFLSRIKLGCALQNAHPKTIYFNILVY